MLAVLSKGSFKGRFCLTSCPVWGGTERLDFHPAVLVVYVRTLDPVSNVADSGRVEGDELTLLAFLVLAAVCGVEDGGPGGAVFRYLGLCIVVGPAVGPVVPYFDSVKGVNAFL